MKEAYVCMTEQTQALEWFPTSCQEGHPCDKAGNAPTLHAARVDGYDFFTWGDHQSRAACVIDRAMGNDTYNKQGMWAVPRET